MTTIYDAPEDFAATALAGFCAIHGRNVRLVRGGVVRSTEVPKGKVSIVVGGGSGHYPAFAGYVGPGFADAAVAGDVFASPSTAAVARVCRHADAGGGIILGFGNYAGDVLNFGVAAERLRGEGIDVRIVPVTDDVASAPADAVSKRRGIAGSVLVYKVAGAAAEAGLPLDEVERVTRLANDRTVSFGVAFGGCTLPGAAGSAVHRARRARWGWDSVSTASRASARRRRRRPPILPSCLSARWSPSVPAGTKKAAALLNGLGSTKYEELFVLWQAVAAELKAHGLEIVEPEAGEFVTSLDMQGCSLSLMWLDEELERYWRAPSDAPVLRKGAIIPAEPAPMCLTMWTLRRCSARHRRSPGRAANALPPCWQTSQPCCRRTPKRLGRLDAIAGDGDHGQGMSRGSAAAANAALRRFRRRRRCKRAGGGRRRLGGSGGRHLRRALGPAPARVERCFQR